MVNVEGELHRKITIFSDIELPAVVTNRFLVGIDQAERPQVDQHTGDQKESGKQSDQRNGQRP